MLLNLRALFFVVSVSIIHTFCSDSQRTIYTSLSPMDLKKRCLFNTINAIAIEKNDPEMKTKLEQFNFDEHNKFKRGELVIIQHAGNFSYAVAIGPQSDNAYIIQRETGSDKGAPACIRNTGAIGKIKKIEDRKQNRENNQSDVAPFTIEQLKSLVVYSPLTLAAINKPLVINPRSSFFSFHDIYQAPSIEFAQKHLAAEGYSFKHQNIFFLGEMVAIPIQDKKNYRYFTGIVIGKGENGEYLILSGSNPKVRETLQFMPQNIGKNILYENFLPSTANQPNKYRTDKFPAIHSAISIIGSIAANNTFTMADIDRFFDFFINNTFERGELIVFQDNDFNYVYGIILGSLGNNFYKIQIDASGNTQTKLSTFIGKMKLDFSMLPENKKLREAVQGATPIIKDLIPFITHNKKSPIQYIKEAIQNNDLKNLDELLGKKNEYLETMDDGGYSPLLFAIYVNNVNAVELLIKRGANIKAKVHNLNALELAQSRQKAISNYNQQIINILEKMLLKTSHEK